MSRPSFRNTSLAAALLAGALIAPLTLGAQASVAVPADAPASAAVSAPARADLGASMRAAPAGAVAGLDASRGTTVTLPGASRTASELAPAAQDAHLGGGRNLAMMGVGAAAVAIGLLIGDDAGTGLAIGGGILGLYGLYRFLK